MASINKVFILGNLGADPETRYTTDGSAIANMRIATTRYWKDKRGERQEETEWHRVVAFGQTAEVASEFLQKGSPVHIEGYLRTRKWTDKDGNDRYSTEIVCDRLTLIGGRGNKDDDDRPERKPAKEKKPEKSASSGGKKHGFEDLEDDIPF